MLSGLTCHHHLLSQSKHLLKLLFARSIEHQGKTRTRLSAALPEPILTQPTNDPANQAELSDSLSIAFLVLLERLSPVERAVFLLQEVFEYDYDEIAQMVGKSPANCRQILKRSRQHITTQRPRLPVSCQQQAQTILQLLEAFTQDNLHGLLSLQFNGTESMKKRIESDRSYTSYTRINFISHLERSIYLCIR